MVDAREHDVGPRHVHRVRLAVVEAQLVAARQLEPVAPSGQHRSDPETIASHKPGSVVTGQSVGDR